MQWCAAWPRYIDDSLAVYRMVTCSPLVWQIVSSIGGNWDLFTDGPQIAHCHQSMNNLGCISAHLDAKPSGRESNVRDRFC